MVILCQSWKNSCSEDVSPMAFKRHSRYAKWIRHQCWWFLQRYVWKRTIVYALYKFVKARKQYIFNCEISLNTCLCETCENAALSLGGLNQACKKSIRCDPHAVVEEYSRNLNAKDCMLSFCEECKSHGLEQKNFIKRNDKTTKMMEIVQAALIAMEMMMQYANIFSGKRG